HVNDTQVTKPARIIGARRTELLSSHTAHMTQKEPDDCLFSIGSFSEVKEGPEESTRWHT
ncbi:hypothetical protein, partial [Escherichia coli]